MLFLTLLYGAILQLHCKIPLKLAMTATKMQTYFRLKNTPIRPKKPKIPL